MLSITLGVRQCETGVNVACRWHEPRDFHGIVAIASDVVHGRV